MCIVLKVGKYLAIVCRFGKTMIRLKFLVTASGVVYDKKKGVFSRAQFNGQQYLEGGNDEFYRAVTRY